jgi:SpoVK/Ycf46/Vps4 family AAA+-type ATPase
VVFEHPKTFATLALDPARKKQVLDDLDMLRNGRDYYARVGKACGSAGTWCTAPGTGKSAMANHLDYDIELTSVHSNTDLRRLFIETTSKSIIVIEDIDCSLDLTGARRDMKKSSSADDKDNTKAAASRPGAGGDEKNKDAAGSSKVTLSGLLNFIDGLWSACGGERVIVFTTNHVDRLDPVLIRRGRMDKHIEMSYCGFDAFRFLAKTYLDVDAHRLFGAVQDLLREVDMTPADVAEYLTPKSLDDDADSCLAALVKALEDDKEKKKAGSGGGDGQDDGQDVEEDQYSSI